MKTLVLVILSLSAITVVAAPKPQAPCPRESVNRIIEGLTKKQKSMGLTLEIRQANLNEVNHYYFWTRIMAMASTLLFAVSISVVSSLLVVLLFHRFFRDPNPQTKLMAYAFSIGLFHVYFLASLVGIFYASRPAKEFTSDFRYVSSSMVQQPELGSVHSALQILQSNRQQLLKTYHRFDFNGDSQGLSLAFGWDQAYLVEFEKTLVEGLFRIDQMEAKILPGAVSEMRSQCGSTQI